MTGKSEHQLNFTIQVLKETLNGHATLLESCIYLWIGQAKTTFLFFGCGENCMLVDGLPTPNNQVFLQSMCTKLCKIFDGKQVYFSTDIGGGEAKDSNYWLKFTQALKQHFDTNKEFYHSD